MRLEAFISELLFEHDCVVLPEFGGIVANYRSARLNTKTYIISPPSKHIGFNRNLKNNDGLLTNHIAVSLGISYKDASQKMEGCIRDYQTKLQKEGRLVLDRIGVFFQDKIGQLQFIPEEQENYLLSSFGLSPVQLKFVAQEELKDEPKVIPLQTEKRKLAGWKIAAAIALPVIIASSVFLSNKASDENFSLATLNPFHREKIITDFVGHCYTFTSSTIAEDENFLATHLDSAVGNVRFDFVNGTISNDGIEIKNIKPKPTPAVSTHVSSESSPIHDVVKHAERSGGYALIGGAFQVQENAENFLQKLITDGFDASFAGKKDGLQLVAYGVYSSKAEAKKALQNIKQSGGHAWIRRN